METPQKNSPNPKIDAALDEIREIMRKYDFAGIAMLVDPEGQLGEIREVEPSWSVLRVLKEGNDSALAWSPTLTQDAATRESYSRKTVNMINALATMTGLDQLILTKTLTSLASGGIPEDQVPPKFRQTPMV